MLFKKWKIYLLWILLAEAVGALAGILSRSGTEYFQEFVNQPPLSPPQWVFPVVWSLLYALMGIGAARVWLLPASRRRSMALNSFVIQLVLNFFWTLVFFNARAYGVASVWIVALWLAVLWMLTGFYRSDRLAGWLQLPYLLWLTFAAYLTFGVWLYNG